MSNIIDPKNSKRKITILDSSQNCSWRSSLKNLVENDKYKIASDDILGTVKDKVWLPMTSVPGMTSKAGLKYPLSNIANGAGDIIKSAITSVTGSEKAAEAIMDVGQAAFEGATGKVFTPWWINLPAYDNGSPYFPQLELTFDFSMGQFGLWNALEEVVKPILNLSAPTLIRELTDFTYTPPFPTSAALLKNALLLETAKGAGEKDPSSFFDIIDILADKAYKGYYYTIVFGDFATYDKMLLVESNSSFGTQVDDKGYPTSGSVVLKYISMTPVTLTSNHKDLVNVKYGVKRGD